MMPTLTAATALRTATFRAGPADRARVHYTTAPSSIGLLLVATAAASPALVAVSIGDSETTLLKELRERFPGARLTRESSGVLSSLHRRVAQATEGPPHTIDLEFDARGTEFQRRVWRALREIPFGMIATYADIARRIGAPRAVRAVAGACAANPLAIIVPCHRVVRSDGSLSGYRWGVARKRELLRREATESAGCAAD